MRNKQIVAESGIDNNLDIGESGTARDYMVHTTLDKKQGVKILDLKSEADLKLTNNNWI